MSIMPGAKEWGIWRWITEYVSPAASVLTILDAVLAVATAEKAVERFGTVINPFWIYVVAYFSVALPLSFALAPLAKRAYASTGAWWTNWGMTCNPALLRFVFEQTSTGVHCIPKSSTAICEERGSCEPKG